MASLVVLVDKVGTPRQSLEFPRSPVRIGRGAGNDVHLPLAFVSDVHAEVEFDERGARFIDLGSTNGSYIAGERVPARVPVAFATTLAVEIGALRLTIARGGEALAQDQALGAIGEPPSQIGHVDVFSPPTIFPMAGEVDAAAAVVVAGELHVPTPLPAVEVPLPGAGGDEGEVALLLCQAFLRLRRSYERCGREMGVRPFIRSRGAALHELDEAAELLQALAAGPAARQALASLVSDMAGHQDALLAAIKAGARAALARSRGREASLDGVTGDAADRALEAALFGPAFAEAYAQGRGNARND